ncbi:hypothetical protein EDC55_10212 [Allofrancisella inopinata]|uniref:Uncharacterized protein n=1 Tax=Allofrancisella inopinata TaxID=1085647 RepID=A0AAE7CR37_9GAMM|nr:hypothetical protein [Allofrancisella inopinata]QIV95909.1 hypothetical protein E4K63_03320 [Allofrancisella inopinata]TDT74326.1 hypothetical protein EDC55_10212 [Allofrancisella inopinata]
MKSLQEIIKEVKIIIAICNKRLDSLFKNISINNVKEIKLVYTIIKDLTEFENSLHSLLTFKEDTASYDKGIKILVKQLARVKHDIKFLLLQNFEYHHIFRAILTLQTASNYNNITDISSDNAKNMHATTKPKLSQLSKYRRSEKSHPFSLPKETNSFFNQINDAGYLINLEQHK